jgi:CBS-domain-containing membrane protein
MDEAYFNHFAKEKMKIHEQLKQNSKLETIIETTEEKLRFERAQREA